MGKFVVKEVKTGFHFNLVASNGQTIGSSEVYTTMASLNKGIESVRKCCEGGVQDLTVENPEEVKHPKFEIYNDKAGEFRFRLKARNGEIILSSEGYKGKPACLNGIESVKKNAPDSPVEKAE
ncbi:MAG: YegP family protein [Firmicutes bacterium]|nr:YegP family protein [Aeriscardovia sp.]MBQ1524818.1 YegP family protein [Bacillota bacterium]MBQ1888554.1 YegP family protein [Bacillota bacterium]MBQ2456118.1 YegP family protein [Bacillota bacterium]MBQ3578818.1 YegP family protein [Bacillota bacterium]